MEFCDWVILMAVGRELSPAEGEDGEKVSRSDRKQTILLSAARARRLQPGRYVTHLEYELLHIRPPQLDQALSRSSVAQRRRWNFLTAQQVFIESKLLYFRPAKLGRSSVQAVNPKCITASTLLGFT